MTNSKKILTHKSSSEGETNKTEVWKDIKGYEGLYQVSNMGRVKSLGRTVSAKNNSKQYRKGRILKFWTNKNGYQLVFLYNVNGERKTVFVHRLVCEAFYPKNKNKPEVNHINEDKSDNRACNLEWVTRKENNNHGTHNTKVAKALSKPVGQYTREGELIKVWQSVSEVQRQLGFTKQNISQAARGKQKTAYGFVWKYVEEEK